MFVDFTHPFGNFCKGISISDVIGDYDAMSTSIVRGGDGLESILTSCVPNLELDYLAINIYGLDFEVHTDGRHEIVVEVVVHKPDE